MPPKTGPIPRQLIEPALCWSGMATREVRTLLRSCEWQVLEPRNGHVVFRCGFAKADATLTLATYEVTKIFDINAERYAESDTGHLRGRLPLPQQRSQAVSSPCGGGGSPHTLTQFPSAILNGYCKRIFLRRVLVPRCRIDAMQ
jgi:hypothetical protein